MIPVWLKYSFRKGQQVQHVSHQSKNYIKRLRHHKIPLFPWQLHCLLTWVSWRCVHTVCRQGLRWECKQLASVPLCLPSTPYRKASHSSLGCPSSRRICAENKEELRKREKYLNDMIYYMINTKIPKSRTEKTFLRLNFPVLYTIYVLTFLRDQPSSWDYSGSAWPECPESRLWEATDRVAPESVAPVEWRPCPMWGKKRDEWARRPGECRYRSCTC